MSDGKIDVNANSRDDAHRVALIGAGNVAVPHLGAINLLPGVRLVGFSSRDDDILAGGFSKREFNIGPTPGVDIDTTGLITVRDYRELIGRSDVDSCIIILPTDMHVEAAELTAKSGKNALLEKPAAPTYTEGLKILEAFSGSAGRLAVGQVVPSFSEFQVLFDEIKRIGLDGIRWLHLNRQVPWSRTDDKESTVAAGGWGPDLIIHDGALALGAVDKPPCAVECIAHWRYNLPQHLQMRLQFPVKNSEGKVPEVSLSVGAKRGFEQPFEHSYAMERVDGSRVHFDGKSVTDTAGIVRLDSSRDVFETFAHELATFVDFATATDSPDPKHLCAEGSVRTLRVIEAAVAQAKASRSDLTWD